jgi:hypothetical protein
MQQIFNQLVQFVQQGVAAIFRFIQLVWTWSVDQVAKVLQTPWQSWPLWKQILLVLIAGAVIWVLYKVAMELLEVGERLLGAFATLLGVLVTTLPRVLMAGFIALGGAWVLNNFDPSFVQLPSLAQFSSR